MADLIPCPSCKKKISVEAQACPKCGQPITDEGREAGRKKMKEEKRAGRIGCIFFILAALAIAGWLGKTDKVDKAAPTSAPVSQAAPAPQQNPQADAPKEQAESQKPVFNLTPEQFVKNFNAAAKEAGAKMRVKPTKSSADSMELAISKQAAVGLKLHNGKVRLAGFVGVPNDLEFIQGIAFTIAGIRPGWSEEKRGTVLQKLVDDPAKDAQTTIDGIQFRMSAIEGGTVIFGATPSN